jgi:hypothetical protein
VLRRTDRRMMNGAPSVCLLCARGGVSWSRECACGDALQRVT